MNSLPKNENSAIMDLPSCLSKPVNQFLSCNSKEVV